jgi:hypothetical protein
MTRRTTLMLTGMTLLGLAIAVPHTAFAQSNSSVGTWKLNLTKSTYSPGPPPRSLTRISEVAGQGLRVTFEGIDAQGNPVKAVFGPYLDDGKPYPVTGFPAADAASYKSVNDSTTEIALMKAGKVVQTAISAVSADGKSLTQTIRGTDANGRQFNNISAYDKQ